MGSAPRRAWGLLAPLLLLLLLLPVPGARGQWDRCGPPPSFPFAETESRYRYYYVGSSVKYSCLPEYERDPSKSAVFTCLPNLTWSGDPEFCLGNIKQHQQSPSLPGRPCPRLEIRNGRVNATSFRFGAEATFSCDEGFALIGETSARCVRIDNRVDWNNQIPDCKRIRCHPPPDIAKGSHSHLSGEEFFVGSAVTYTCDQGLSLVGEASIHCVTKDNLKGEWSGPAPECKVQCPVPEVQSATMVSALDKKKRYDVNETIPFKCSPGYQFSSRSSESATGSLHITCLADGRWTELPECEKQSTSDMCEVVPKLGDFVQCDVPLTDMKDLLELQKLYLEIEKLKQEMKLQ